VIGQFQPQASPQPVVQLRLKDALKGLIDQSGQKE